MKNNLESKNEMIKIYKECLEEKEINLKKAINSSKILENYVKNKLYINNKCDKDD